MTVGENSVMVMLRDGTGELHSSAEKQPFQRALIRGETSQAIYGAYLGQMLHIHSALETALAGCGERVLRSVVLEEQFQAANLDADLAALGISPKPDALPATLSLVYTISARPDAASLLGHLYVLEGSKNGNAFVARAIRGALRLTPGTGDRYLDPHGAEQRPVWAGFKGRMDGLEWSAEQRAAMLDAAKAMFAGIVAVSVELEELRQAERARVGDRDVALDLTR